MSNDQTDIQVRVKKAIADIIKTTKPKAKVYPWWVLDEGIDESVPYFKSVEEDEWGSAPYIHAYILGFDAFPRERTGPAQFTDTLELKLWGFYQFTLGNEDKNSEDIFSVHLKEVQNAITAATKFQTVDNPNGVPETIKHGEWQIEKVGNYWMDEEKVHIAQGSIHVYPRLIINPVSIT